MQDLGGVAIKMNIKGSTRTCGLIGNPIKHTMSPTIHNNLASMLGIDLVYVPFQVEEDKVGDAIKGAYALNILGLNVTVPHKSAVIPYLCDIDELAKGIGAVNTLVRTEDGYKGYNTDILGLYRAMQTDGVSLEDEDVIVLGAGGAGRAVTFMCATKGAGKVYLLNRSLDKAKAIAADVNRTLGCDKVEAVAISEYSRLPKNKYIVIQSTSVGLAPNVDDVVIDDEAFYENVKVGYDLIYNPAATRFMKLCKEAGAPAYNGLKMLLYQGVAAFELWNDCKVSEADADKIYELMKQELGI